MHAERDYLIKRVFPELRDWCLKYHIHLIDIDLRWGITEEDSIKNKRVIDVCLKSIDDCHPFFLCLLGQRRGWVPTSDDVSESTFKDWHEVSDWIGNTSITEMEVLHTIKKNNSVDDISDHCLFLFRDDAYVERLNDVQKKIYLSDCKEDSIIFNSFKNEIRKKYPSVCLDYSADWDSDKITDEINSVSLTVDELKNARKGRLTNFKICEQIMADKILSFFKERIKKEYPGNFELSAMSPLDEDYLNQDFYVSNIINSSVFVDFSVLIDYINGSYRVPMIVHSKAGYGKTTIIASLIEELKKQDSCLLLYRFVEAYSYKTETSLLKSLMQELSEKGYDDFLDDNINESTAVSYFNDFFLKNTDIHKKTIIIIDAWDKLVDSVVPKWLPVFLSENIKIIITISSENVTEHLYEKQKRNQLILYQIPEMNKSEQERFVREYLKGYLKQLDVEQEKTLLSSKYLKNPLYAKIVLSELRLFGSFEGLNEKIKKSFGESEKSAFYSLIDRLKNENGNFVEPFFILLAISKDGLSVDEIAEIIGQKNNIMDTEMLKEAIWLVYYQIRQFIFVRNSKLNYGYSSFRNAILHRYSENISAYSEILLNYCNEKIKTSVGTIKYYSERAYQLFNLGKSEMLLGFLSDLSYVSSLVKSYGLNEYYIQFEYIEDLLISESEVAVSIYKFISSNESFLNNNPNSIDWAIVAYFSTHKTNGIENQLDNYALNMDKPFCVIEKINITPSILESYFERDFSICRGFLVANNKCYIFDYNGGITILNFYTRRFISFFRIVDLLNDEFAENAIVDNVLKYGDVIFVSCENGLVLELSTLSDTINYYAKYNENCKLKIINEYIILYDDNEIRVFYQTIKNLLFEINIPDFEIIIDILFFDGKVLLFSTMKKRNIHFSLNISEQIKKISYYKYYSDTNKLLAVKNNIREVKIIDEELLALYYDRQKNGKAKIEITNHSFENHIELNMENELYPQQIFTTDKYICTYLSAFGSKGFVSLYEKKDGSKVGTFSLPSSFLIDTITDDGLFVISYSDLYFISKKMINEMDLGELLDRDLIRDYKISYFEIQCCDNLLMTKLTSMNLMLLFNKKTSLKDYKSIMSEKYYMIDFNDEKKVNLIDECYSDNPDCVFQNENKCIITKKKLLYSEIILFDRESIEKHKIPVYPSFVVEEDNFLIAANEAYAYNIRVQNKIKFKKKMTAFCFGNGNLICVSKDGYLVIYDATDFSLLNEEKLSPNLCHVKKIGLVSDYIIILNENNELFIRKLWYGEEIKINKNVSVDGFCVFGFYIVYHSANSVYFFNTLNLEEILSFPLPGILSMSSDGNRLYVLRDGNAIETVNFYSKYANESSEELCSCIDINDIFENLKKSFYLNDVDMITVWYEKLYDSIFGEGLIKSTQDISSDLLYLMVISSALLNRTDRITIILSDFCNKICAADKTTSPKVDEKIRVLEKIRLVCSDYIEGTNNQDLAYEILKLILCAYEKIVLDSQIRNEESVLLDIAYGYTQLIELSDTDEKRTYAVENAVNSFQILFEKTNDKDYLEFAKNYNMAGRIYEKAES